MMNIMFLKKGKIVFQVLSIVLFQWSTTICQLNLYDTDQRFQSNSLQYDCLNYHIRHETLAYQDLLDVVDEVIPYCVRPAADFHESFGDFDDSHSHPLSFKELHMTNITAEELLSWSIAMEVAERYQMYLNAPHSTSNEYFYNCTSPRFGLRCQYSFEFGKGQSFNEIVKADFYGRTAYSDSSAMIVQTPCYVLLPCHRNGKPWCLDWREVCDGNIDCFDEGIDEQSCFDMEINECHDDEYRCHNGLCISQEFWEDGQGDADCLDRSDRAIDISYMQFCFQDPSFRCEEHSCRTSSNLFSCGDGKCVRKFQNCDNGRHVLLIESMAVQGNLSDECWNAMICLTGLVKKGDQNLCEIWLINEDAAYKALEQCGSFFQFPTVPVQSDHIRLFYENPHLKLNMGQFLLPDYICYNQQLCDSIIPDLVYENQTCVNASNIIDIWNNSPSHFWIYPMALVGEFFRICSIFQDTSRNKTSYDNIPALYNCQGSSKFISKHRIMDRERDCPNYDDEFYPNSCQLNDRYRVKCVDETKCWSPIVKNDACLLNNLRHTGKIRFQSFCNGITEYFYGNTTKTYDDEFGCENWCDNMYGHCDGFWACKDGRDEYNCSRTICPSQTYACISHVEYTVICLPSNLVNDSIVHCLGALDEQTRCRLAYPSRDTVFPFRCMNDIRCLQISQVCNGKKDCSEGDDENENLCKNQRLACDKVSPHNRSHIDEILCGLNEVENRRIRYFSVHTSSNYPLVEKVIDGEFNRWSAEHRLVKAGKVSQVQNNPWPWYCHRGLAMRTWTKNSSSNYITCICPPSYYGHLCQYQNQRVSLTLRLTSNDRHATYAIVSMLIDDTDERQQIHAYDQFVYIAKNSCSMKLNRYLLFSSRPKNISRNYSIRIDVLEKNAITYVGSWHFPIAFLFLPVNRLSVALNLSNHLLQYSSNCSNKCVNGEYVKYINKANSYCRCHPTWSGIQCDIPINCHTCSSESICIGSANNRSICVCPIDRYGPHCLFQSKCSNNACQNNGQCIPADMSISGNNYTCICSDQFFGQNCQHRKAKLDVSMIDIDIPRYLVGYFFTLSNKSDPTKSIMLRKLTLFQRMVTFYVAAPFQLTFIQANDKYYLAVLQQSPKIDISTSISPKQECISTQQLLNSSVLNMIPYQRIIHFYWLCYTNYNLTCFMDETYLCLCTNDHHANCMEFNQPNDFTCPFNNYCQNGGQCLQNHPTCPSTKICVCPSCFFGSQCQFYSKGLDVTLDEILGYEFKRNKPLFEQPMTVIMAGVITILIFLIGMINSILSIIIFAREKCHDVGCGIYLLASSITSLCIMIVLMFKFWFLFYSHRDHKNETYILNGNCFGVELFLKAFLYLGHWLSACVALERALNAFQGPKFNKNRSRKIALWIIPSLFGIIWCLFIPQMIYLHVFHDNTEERSWCVVKYVGWLATYNSVLIFFHYFGPLTVNLLSILSVLIITTHHRSRTDNKRNYWFHLRLKARENKNMLISSTIIICLTLPYLIISIILDCQKSPHLFWFYLIGYFLKFFPAAFIFIIFVLPSSFYRKEFYGFI